MAKARYGKWIEPEGLVLIQGWKRDGLTDEEIAKKMGVSARTLEYWKKQHVQILQAIKRGREDVNFQVENKLLTTAMQGNVTAMIFYLKHNWTEKYADQSKEDKQLVRENIRRAKAEAGIAEKKSKLIDDTGSTERITFVNDVPKEDDIDGYGNSKD
jgi:DNA-binding transcriptional MerR regulator